VSGYTTSAALSPASLEWAGMGAYLNAGGARCSSPGRGAPTSGPPSPLAPFMISCAVAGTARRDPPAAGAPPLAHKRQNTRKSKATSRGRATQLHCGAAQWECAQASSHCNAALPAHCILAKQASGAPARTRPPAPTSARGRRRFGCSPCACGAVSRQHPTASRLSAPPSALPPGVFPSPPPLGHARTAARPHSAEFGTRVRERVWERTAGPRHDVVIRCRAQAEPAGAGGG